LVYLCALLGLLHYFWLVKADLLQPMIYAGLLAALLAVRWRPQLLGRAAWSGRTVKAR
jgi:sulfoxide reductase heme-binding subunit YedZ